MEKEKKFLRVVRVSRLTMHLVCVCVCFCTGTQYVIVFVCLRICVCVFLCTCLLDESPYKFRQSLSKKEKLLSLFLHTIIRRVYVVHTGVGSGWELIVVTLE